MRPRNGESFLQCVVFLQASTCVNMGSSGTQIVRWGMLSAQWHKRYTCMYSVRSMYYELLLHRDTYTNVATCALT